MTELEQISKELRGIRWFVKWKAKKKQQKEIIFKECMWQLNHHVSCLRCKKHMPLHKFVSHMWNWHSILVNELYIAKGDQC